MVDIVNLLQCVIGIGIGIGTRRITTPLVKWAIFVPSIVGIIYVAENIFVK